MNFDTPQETLKMQLKEGVRYVTSMAYGGHGKLRSRNVKTRHCKLTLNMFRVMQLTNSSVFKKCCTLPN